MPLPFLYAHGAIVWKLLLPLLVVAACAALDGILRLLGWANARWALAEAKQRAVSLRAGAGTFRGVIVEGDASFADGVLTGHELVIEIDSHLVHVTGGVKVELGARRGATRGVMRLGVGDEVYVTGRAVRGEDGWTMPDDSPAVELVSAEPDRRSNPISRQVWTGLALVFSALGYIGLRAAGHIALEHAHSHDEWRETSELASFDALAVAAAMPGTQDDAVVELSFRLEEQFPHSEPALQLRSRLLVERGKCPVELWLRASRYMEALAAARLCGSPDDLARTLVFAGHYDEAAVHAAPDSYLGATVAIAQRRWGAAAHAVEAIGGAHAGCFALTLRAFGDDQRALRDLEQSTDVVCQTGGALLLSFADARTKLEGLRGPDVDDETKTYIRDAWRAVGGEGSNTPDVSLALMFPGSDEQTRIWFAAERLRTLPTATIDEVASVHAQLGYQLLLRGDARAARSHALLAKALIPEGLRPDILLTAIALIEPQLSPPARAWLPEGISEGVSTRLGLAPRPSGILRCDLPYIGATIRAWTGDGGDLASVVNRCRIGPTDQWALIGVLPRVREHRAELAASLRVFDLSMGSPRLDHIPFGAIEIAAQHRNIANLIGDTAEARDQQRIVDRHVAPLADPKVVLGFMILHHL